MLSLHFQAGVVVTTIAGNRLLRPLSRILMVRAFLTKLTVGVSIVVETWIVRFAPSNLKTMEVRGTRRILRNRGRLGRRRPSSSKRSIIHV